MTRDDAVWVAQQYLKTYSPGRVGMLLSDEAVHAVCEALVKMAEQGIALGAACCEREKAELRACLDDTARALDEKCNACEIGSGLQAERDALRAQLDALTQVAAAPSGIETAVDTHIATHGAAPLVVPEDRTKPPHGYEVYSRPALREGRSFWWACSVDGTFQTFRHSQDRAIAAAWADYDARKAPCCECGGDGKILEDHDGRAGYRKCACGVSK